MFNSVEKKMKVLATTTRGVSHYGLAMYIKMDFKEKENNYENSNISPWVQKKYNLQKIV
jgi:hypothetical protein